MKKYFLLLLIIFPFITMAQSEKGLYVGLTTQFQNTRILNDEQYENVNYRHKFTTKWAPIGATVGYKFNENHNFQIEVIRSNQGESFDLVDQDGNKSGEKTIDLVYYNIPVLFKYTTAGTLRFNFHLGPQISILQKGREENHFSRTASYVRDKENLTIQAGHYLLASSEDGDRSGNNQVGNFNKYDLGLAVGLGLEYSFTPATYLSANIRTHYNFVNIRDDEYIRVPVDPDYYVLRHNLVLGVQLGIHFLFNTGDGESPARHQ